MQQHKHQLYTMSIVRGYSISAQKEKDDAKLKKVKNNTSSPAISIRDYQISKGHEMSYRQLGMTPIKVSIIAFGCGAIGGLFGDFKGNLEKLLYEAFRNGINYIDTGYWYGQARSEELLGQALKKIPRQNYYISTKIGRFELDFSRAYDYRADVLLEQLTMSLKRLKLDYVDICYLQLRNTDFNMLAETIFNESLEALRIAKVTGRTRYIGLAAYTLRNIIYVLEKSDLKIDVVMTYGRATLCDNSLGEYRHRFELNGVAIVNGAPLSMGLLTDKGPPQWHPAPSTVLRTASEAAYYCKNRGISVSKLAIDYATQFPGISTCLVGVKSMNHLLQCLQIANCDSLTSDEGRIRNRIYRRYFDKVNNANWENTDLYTYWKRMEHKNWSKTFKKHSRLQLN
uniref:NADP-dependent oxidoreductase domain-containing protein n=1 Tax=Setaria digitata TaxID=48799 RepID=A0A915PT43_9BILA